MYDLASELARNGRDVEVVTSEIGSKPGVTNEGGLKVTRLKSSEFANTAILWNLLPWLIKHARRDAIVHVHVGQAYTPEIVWLASKLCGFKYIFHMHIELVQSSRFGELLPIYKKWILKRAVKGASLLIVLNEEHRGIMKHVYDYRKPILVMSNGISDDCFTIERVIKRRPSHALKLLFVGRLSPQKNLPALLDALSILNYSVHLDILGDGKERELIESLIKDKNLKNVHLRGRASRDEVLHYYATSDVMILPSLYEAQPLVLLEAMAVGIPIIATDVIGNREVIKDAGLMIEPSPEGIAHGLELFINNRNVIKHKTESAHEKALNLRWSTLIHEYEQLYDKYF